MVSSLAFALAGSVAILKTIQSVVQNKAVLDSDEYVTAWAHRTLALPTIFIYIVVTAPPIPSNPPKGLFIALLFSGCAGTLGSLLVNKAYKTTDVSLITPLFALSPVGTLVMGSLILGETPSLQGIGGVLLITTGVYFLKAPEDKAFFAPLVAIARERGAQLVLVVILVYTISSNVDKIGATAVHPTIFTASIYMFMASLLTVFMLLNTTNWFSSIRQNWKVFFGLGTLAGLSSLAQYTAITMTVPVIVISIKRLSIPLTVVLGYFLFDEENLRGRLIGSTIMVAGALLILTG